MEKGTDSARLDKIKAEIQSLREEMQNKVCREELYVFRLEDYCNSLKYGIINNGLNLPSISSFTFYFSKLKASGNIEYILNLLHECWILAHPDKMFEPIYKYNNPIKTLEKSLCKYSKDESIPDEDSIPHDDFGSYDVVSEELNASINTSIARIYYGKVCKNKTQLYLYREYLDELYKAICGICNDNEISIEKGFIAKCCLKVALGRNQLLSLFEDIASEGFVMDDKATRNSFLSLFSNTIHTTNKKIIWLDVNKKNGQPSIASLYVMFSAMGIEMNIHNKSIICKLFNDANNKPISPESLKPRKESDTLLKIKSLVDKARNR